MRSESQDKYETLSSRNDIAFDEFYKIYEDSIQANERKNKIQIAEMLTRPDYKVLVARREGKIVGFSVLFIPLNEAFCLLEYIAVHREYRRMGIGQGLFCFSVQTVISERGNIPILLEVDSDREASEDQRARHERKQFYRKLGCYQIDGLSYRLPLPTQGTPPEMDLMVYTSDRSPSIPKDQSEHWLRVIYHTVYDCDDDDPRISRMLEPVTDPLTLH